MKRYSSLANREMQRKTMSYPFTPVRSSKIMMLDHAYTVGGNADSYSYSGKVCQLLKYLHRQLPYDSATVLLDI